MLILFAIFIDYAYNDPNQTPGAIKIYKTMAAFFFLLFGNYLLFVILLGSFKSVIIVDSKRFSALKLFSLKPFQIISKEMELFLVEMAELQKTESLMKCLPSIFN